MKYLKKYNESIESIESICKKLGIENYTINQDGSIDVNGSVDISVRNLKKLPLKFNKVTGDFICRFNQLTSLVGSPKTVGGYFYCTNNKLTSLEGGPNKVGGDFDCHSNKLTSLEGGPKEVDGDFYCSYNQLTSLVGSPKTVGGYFYCTNNKLTSLEGGPEEVGGSFYCSNNPIWEIFKLFKDYNQFKSLLDDFSYLRGTNIIKRRFEEVCIDAGIKIPQKINGYDYI